MRLRNNHSKPWRHHPRRPDPTCKTRADPDLVAQRLPQLAALLRTLRGQAPVESPAPQDLDNVAKACLDALNGAVWHDDKPVRHLTVEKLDSETAAVTLAVAPYPQAAAEGARDGLSALLARVEALDAAVP